MTEITIPAAALEAGRAAYERSWENGGDPDDWFRAAFLAMLAAWEGAKTIRDDGRRQTYAIPALILPLPQENSDE